MKNYTTIPNNIASKLNSADTYRYTALSFTPIKDGYTDSTFKQIGEYSSPNNPEPESTIKHFVERLKDSELIKIEETWIDGKKRNKYYMPKLTSDFRIVKSELLEADLAVECKGLLIQLFTICLNGTYDCNLSLNKIVTLINISKPTASKYLKILVDGEYVVKTDKGFTINSKYFEIGATKKENEIKAFKIKWSNYEPIKRRIDSINWDKVRSQKGYMFYLETGVPYKSKEKQSQSYTFTL